MRRKLQIAAFAVATLGLVLVTVPSLLQAHEEQKAQPQPGQAPQMMGQGMTGQGVEMMPGMESLMMPQIDPARGRKLFASKGCVVCHSVNGIGGEDAPPLDTTTMRPIMNPFEFAAKMWGGAEAMIYLQQEELGEQIVFTGQELGDIIAFVHHPEEQKKFSEADIPPRMKDLMKHIEAGEPHEEGGAHEADEPKE